MCPNVAFVTRRKSQFMKGDGTLDDLPKAICIDNGKDFSSEGVARLIERALSVGVPPR